MSYILDALRRAEAERQRGTVPGLHAQPATGTLPAGPDGPDTAQRRWRVGTRALAGLLLAGLLAAAAGLGWLLKPAPAAIAVGLPSALPPAVVGSAVPAAPAGLRQAAAPAGGRAPPQLPAPAAVAPVVPLVSPLARSATEPAAAPTRQLATAAPDVALATPAPAAVLVAPAPAAALAAPALAAALAAPATASAAPAPAVAGPGTAPVRLPTLAELPEALRREVQPLNLGGSVYAEQPPLRIVIINGQVFHEGDKPLPALQVQQIRLKSVVLSVRGQRFEVPL